MLCRANHLFWKFYHSSFRNTNDLRQIANILWCTGVMARIKPKTLWCHYHSNTVHFFDSFYLFSNSKSLTCFPSRRLSTGILNTTFKSTILKHSYQCVTHFIPDHHVHQWFQQKVHFLSKCRALWSVLRVAARPSFCGWCWLSVWPTLGWALLSGNFGSVGCIGSRSPQPPQCRSGRWHYKACWNLE